MSNILITGATGFIGSNLARSLDKKKHNITLLVRKKSNLWRFYDIISDYNIREVDLLKYDALRREIKEIRPDIVYHCATYGLHHSQTNLKTIMQTNIVGSTNLMQILNEYNDVNRIINIGSSHEYGSKLKGIRETETTMPITAYGIAKLAQTQVARYFSLVNNLPVVTLRFFTIYGMYEEPGHLISDIMLASIKKQDLKIFSLKTKRDFVYIRDVITALHKAAEVKRIEGEIFNIGNGIEYSALEILNHVNEISDFNIKIISHENEIKNTNMIRNNGYAIIEKARRLLRWRPSFSIKKGLLETHNWYKENINLYSSF